jgi:1,4-dihydroxy-2-naphthoate octaprenyltransferase
MLVVLLALPTLRAILPVYAQPKPGQRPEAYSAEIWPLWFVALAFYHNRRFGLLFLLGLIGEVVIHSFLL